ncbi:hypothetical protein BC826DRAFT_719377 [Russula brevipes]|nr:hypothetical protein BC826DRAFT_719377 [Russula brevipes]
MAVRYQYIIIPMLLGPAHANYLPIKPLDHGDVRIQGRQRYLSSHFAFLSGLSCKTFMNSRRWHFGDSNHAVQWKHTTHQYALPSLTLY